MSSYTSSKYKYNRHASPNGNGQVNALHSHQAYDVDVEYPVAHMPLHQLERQFHYHQQQQQQQQQQQEHHEAQQRLPIRQGQGQEQEVNADVVIDATSSVLQHDDSVIDNDDVVLHYQPTHNPESIPPITEQHHHQHQYQHHYLHHQNIPPPIIPSPLMHYQQQQGHQMDLKIAYNNHQQYSRHQEQQQQQQQQQDRSSSSVDSTTLLDERTVSLYDNQSSPLSIPSRPKTSILSTDSDKNETESRKNKKVNDIDTTEKKKNAKRNRQQTGKKQQQGMEGGSLLAVVGTASKKPRRRRYENDLKLEVLEQLKVPHAKFSDVASRYSIPENTLRDWRKAKVAHAIETAQEKNCGRLKANVYDPMRRLTETLVTFFEHNKQQPRYLRQSITTKFVVAKGIEARDKLIKRHDTHPYLDPKEIKALETFIGSDSWAKKFAKRADLKMTGARVKELKDEEVNEYHQSLKKMATHVRQAGICYEEVANLLRQAAEKLLRASIIQSTASNRLMGDIAVTNSRNGNGNDLSQK